MSFQYLKCDEIVQIQINDPNHEFNLVVGIILGIEENEVVVLTNTGNILKLNSNYFLNVLRCDLDNYVEQKLEELRDFYIEMNTLKYNLEKMKYYEKEMVSQLVDATFLSNYSLEGAKNRIISSLDPILFSFYKNMCSYKISVKTGFGENLELYVNIINHVNHNNNTLVNREIMIKRYAPNEEICLKNCFKGCSVYLENQDYCHVEMDDYKVYSTYKIIVPINCETFLQQREFLRNSLYQLRK